MRIYCFEIEDGLDWPTGTAVTARDRRTSSSVLLYRSLDREPNAEASAPQPVDLMERRHRARAVLDTLPTQRPASAQAFRPPVEFFSCNDFIAIAAHDASAAKPALEKLRAAGLFLERRKPPPPPPPPPPPRVCANCREATPLANGLCAACAQQRKALPKAAPPKSHRSRVWLILLLAAALIAGAALYFWSPDPTPQTVVPAMAPVVRFEPSQRTVKKGGRVVLSWNTSGLSSLSISPGIGPVAASGKRSVVIDRDTTFSLFATGPGFTSPVTITVSVAKPSNLAPIPQAPVEPAQAKPLSQLSQPASPEPDRQSYQAIRDTLDALAASYRANDPQRQATLYASRVDRFFLRQNVDNAFVLNYMIAFYGRGSRFTAFSFSAPDILFDDPANAKAMFVKRYTIQLANGQRNDVDSRSELHLTRIQGLWKITFERDFKAA